MSTSTKKLISLLLIPLSTAENCGGGVKSASTAKLYKAIAGKRAADQKKKSVQQLRVQNNGLLANRANPVVVQPPPATSTAPASQNPIVQPDTEIIDTVSNKNPIEDANNHIDGEAYNEPEHPVEPPKKKEGIWERLKKKFWRSGTEQSANAEHNKGKSTLHDFTMFPDAHSNES